MSKTLNDLPNELIKMARETNGKDTVEGTLYNRIIAVGELAAIEKRKLRDTNDVIQPDSELDPPANGSLILIDSYQALSAETDLMKDHPNRQDYYVFGLVSEVGELVEAIQSGSPQRITKEVGDCCWYIAQIATVNELKLSTIMWVNIRKLFSRWNENKIKGSGDNR